MRARHVIVTVVLAGALAAGAAFVLESREPADVSQNGCPQFTPMHGLMPLLFRMGILPKPPIAATIAPSNTSTSIVIRPDRSDQIRCEKAPIKTVKDLVYAAPGLPGGKSTSLKMDLLIPAAVRKRTVVVYVPGAGS